MGVKECPHCGNVVSGRERRCSCGFPFPTDGLAPSGAKAARVVAERQRKRAERQKKKTGKKGRFWEKSEPEPEPEPKPAPRSKSRGARKPAAAGKAGGGRKLAGIGSDESRLMACPFCNARISKRAHTCPKCGVAPWAGCQICGAQISSDCSACPECGDPDPFSS